VLLSFDDGPSPTTTPAVLQLLRQAGVRAAFFLNGARAERYPALVQALVEDGHGVFSHTYDHIRFEYLSGPEIRAQLARCEAVLHRHRATPSPYPVRLPYGSGHRDPAVHRALRAWRADCEIIHWSLSFDDYRLADDCSSEAELRRRCVDAAALALARPRLPGSIVLLHEDPFGVDAPLASRIAPVLLEALLDRSRAKDIALADEASPVTGRFRKQIRWQSDEGQLQLPGTPALSLPARTAPLADEVTA